MTVGAHVMIDQHLDLDECPPDCHYWEWQDALDLLAEAAADRARYRQALQDIARLGVGDSAEIAGGALAGQSVALQDSR